MDIIELKFFVRFSFRLLNSAVFLFIPMFNSIWCSNSRPFFKIRTFNGYSCQRLNCFFFQSTSPICFNISHEGENRSNWELVEGKMSNDSISPVRFLNVVCDFEFERRILPHISWGLMLDGFVKVMACFRNLIYSFLYSCTSLEKLALSNGAAILPAAFSIACISFENMSSYVVS